MIVSGTPGDLSTFNMCVMDGLLFSTRFTTPQSIASCSLTNCAATLQPAVQAISDTVTVGPVCDSASQEIVWLTGSPTVTIHRATENGTNARSITSVLLPDSDWAIANNAQRFSNGRADRMFYVDNNSTTQAGSLYYVSTTAQNTSGVLVAMAPQEIVGAIISVLANDDTVLFNSGITTVLKAPLPNGVLSGTPPIFIDGQINAGVMDASSFYGTIGNSTTVPSDALVRCLSSGCSNPTVISRGQAGANYFAQDATGIYWTVANTTSASGGFTVWKAAK